MKTKQFSTYITILLFSCFFSACKRKGCTDFYAENYNEKHKKEDGSCTYNNNQLINKRLQGEWVIKSFDQLGEEMMETTYISGKIVFTANSSIGGNMKKTLVDTSNYTQIEFSKYKVNDEGETLVINYFLPSYLSIDSTTTDTVVYFGQYFDQGEVSYVLKRQ